MDIKKVNIKKISKSRLILIISIAIIAIPIIVFIAILGISAIQTGSPRDGSRFKNDLVNKISSSDAKDIKKELETLSNVEDVDAKVSEGQFKVYIDTNDSISEEEFDSIVKQAYEKVTAKLPINTYFTKIDNARMYDLQINVYTTSEASEGRLYKLLHKNSSEESYQIDDLVHPKDQDLVNELEGIVPEGESSTEIEDIEEVEEIEDDGQ